MSNPKAVKAMQELRAEHQKEMQAWTEQYGSDPSSAEAQAALQKLRQEHWNDMRGLFKRFGIKAPATARSWRRHDAWRRRLRRRVRRRRRDRRGSGHRLRRRHDGLRQLALMRQRLSSTGQHRR